MNDFGKSLRKTREKRYEKNVAYSVRKVAGRVGIEPSYLSKIERGEQAPPSERAIVSLAKELELNTDVLLARAGKISHEVKWAILKKPESLPEIVRSLGGKSKQELIGILNEYKNGK